MQESLFENNDRKDLINIKEASEILGVSDATIRNWVKTGQISYIDTHNTKNGSKHFERDLIEKYKEDIKQGRALRLNNRANKRNSKTTFIPIEQIDDKNLIPTLHSYLDLVKTKKISVEKALFLHSFSVLKKEKLLDFTFPITDIQKVSFKNDNVKKVILEWYRSLKDKDFNWAEYQDLVKIDSLPDIDSLGIIYQSLLNEGKKAQQGSYYTPPFLIDGICNDMSSYISSGTKILDPCCGTGQFLKGFSKYITNPSLLWGYDIDPIAVNIARVNLLSFYPNTNFYPNIYQANSLIDNPNGQFDIITTNPPWGYHFTKEETSNLTKIYYPYILSNEAFSYFLVRGIELLKKNGFLCYVLPEAIIKIKQHRDIREYILKNSRIINIKHLGNIFSKVVSPVITLSLQKTQVKNNTIEVSQKNGSKNNLKQERFIKNVDYIFDTNINENDMEIIDKIYKSSSFSLKNNAEWALGIVTGNNNKFISQIKNDKNEGVLRGSDIKKYYFNEPKSFITFVPKEFQQVAPEYKFRAKEKLIYKFISNRLSFAYDNKQTLTLNSANILIPKMSGITIKATLAFLNSDVFQFIFQKKFNTVKILRGNLEELPFPILTKKETEEIEKLVDYLISNTDYTKKELAVNKIVYEKFKLSIQEIQYIKKTIGG